MSNHCFPPALDWPRLAWSCKVCPTSAARLNLSSIPNGSAGASPTLPTSAPQTTAGAGTPNTRSRGRAAPSRPARTTCRPTRWEHELWESPSALVTAAAHQSIVVLLSLRFPASLSPAALALHAPCLCRMRWRTGCLWTKSRCTPAPARPASTPWSEAAQSPAHPSECCRVLLQYH